MISNRLRGRFLASSALLAMSVGILPPVSVSASTGVVGAFIEDNRSEVERVSRAYGLLPSVLMSRLLLESSLGSSRVDVERTAQSVFLSGSGIDRRLAETASQEESVALLFSSRYERDYGFVSEMNALLDYGDISSLDMEVFSDGYKPVYDYDDMRTAIEKGDISSVSPKLRVPLSTDSLGLPSSSVSGLSLDVEVSNMAYSEVFDESILGQLDGFDLSRLIDGNLGVDLLSNGDNNKKFYEFWKSGYREVNFSVLNRKGNLAPTALSRAFEEVRYFGLSSKIDDSVFKTSLKGIYAIGSGKIKVLVTDSGRLVGVFSESKPVKKLFGTFEQVVDVDEGFVTLGLRASSLSEGLLGLNNFVDFTNKGLDATLIQTLPKKPVKQFFFPPLYKVLYLVEVEGGYEVVDSSLNKIGSSFEVVGDSSYTIFESEVGSLWLRF